MINLEHWAVGKLQPSAAEANGAELNGLCWVFNEAALTPQSLWLLLGAISNPVVQTVKQRHKDIQQLACGPSASTQSDCPVHFSPLLIC